MNAPEDMRLEEEWRRWLKGDPTTSFGKPFVPGVDRHRYSVDLDRCACGGEVVWFEDGPPSQRGEGCDAEGRSWRK